MVATVAVAACGSSAEPTEPVLPALAGPSYSISMSGDVRATLQGVPTSIRSASGYREIDKSGIGETTAVLVPPNAPAGAKYQATGASVEATGTFVVAAPTLTVP